jgi:hypothetical protein
MKNSNSEGASPEHKEKRHGCLQVLGVAVTTVIIIGLVIGGWVKYNIYASEFSPTTLRQEDQKVLDGKLAVLRYSSGDRYDARLFNGKDYTASLEPEAYSEKGARREINLTEKELNALIANKPDVAKRVAIDLSEDLLSLKLVVPMDEEIIFLGGKTLRLKVGVALKYKNDQLVVALKGVSLGGIPVPNAWLGYLKNKNLVEEFGDEGGFWALFSEGVKDIRVREGHIRVRLRE